MPSHRDDRTRLDAGALQEIDSVADMPSLFLWLSPEEQEERAHWLTRIAAGRPKPDHDINFPLEDTDPFPRRR